MELPHLILLTFCDGVTISISSRRGKINYECTVECNCIPKITELIGLKLMMADPTVKPSKLCHTASRVAAFSGEETPHADRAASPALWDRGSQHRNRRGLRSGDFLSLLRVGTHRWRHIMCKLIHARVERNTVG